MGNPCFAEPKGEEGKNWRCSSFGAWVTLADYKHICEHVLSRNSPLESDNLSRIAAALKRIVEVLECAPWLP